MINSRKMISREIYPKLYSWAKKGKIIILKGPRQAGKTTLMNFLLDNLKKEGQNTAYLLADDIDKQELFKSPAALEFYLSQKYNFPEKHLFLFIDEFQYIDQAGLFIKNFFDKHQGQVNLILSGSSSLEITQNQEFLTGRAVEFEMGTVNFREFFNFREGTRIKKFPLESQDDLSNFYKSFESKLSLALKNFLVFGGYPEVVETSLEEDKKVILKSIVKKYLEKDVAGFLQIENITAFNNLTKILASQIGNLVNISELANTVNLSINTVKRYLDVLQGTYVFSLVRPYAKNIRKELSKMPKVYIQDLGAKNYLLGDYKDNLFGGKEVENFVFLGMANNLSSEGVNFYRTKGGSEVDFILEKEGGLNLIEVKYRSVSKIKEPLAFANFSENYGDRVQNKIVISKDVLKKDGNIYFIPAVLWPWIEL